VLEEREEVVEHLCEADEEVLEGRRGAEAASVLGDEVEGEAPVVFREVVVVGLPPEVEVVLEVAFRGEGVERRTFSHWAIEVAFRALCIMVARAANGFCQKGLRSQHAAALFYLQECLVL
jgi:hypothetical protein